MKSERTSLAGAQDGAHTQCSVHLTDLCIFHTDGSTTVVRLCVGNRLCKIFGKIVNLQQLFDN